MPAAERPVVLVDRDGTINVEVDYLRAPEQVALLPNAAAGLRQLRELGYRIVVITNQSGLGRGYFDLATLSAIHERLAELLAAQGASVDAIYHCPHLPTDGCACRKPGTALVEQAARDLGFDPGAAYIIGDKPCDIDLGHAIGASTILVRTGYGRDHEAHTDAHHVVDDLLEAARMIGNQRRDARVREWLTRSIAVKQATLDESVPSVVDAAVLIAESLRAGGKLMICGNGGSAADAQHMAAELVSRLTMSYERPGLAALALTTDSSFLTAFTNDIDFEHVFARQVQALGKPGDVLLGISTSGSSKNVIAAVEQAHEMGIRTVALVGEGGKLPDLVDVAIRVASGFTPHIQETHISIEHVLCDIVEREIYGYEGTL